LLSLGSKKMISLAAKPNNEDLKFLANLLENGVIKPVIERRYTLDQASEAMNYMSQGHASGKVIIML
jgi:NADPH:quinone reductase-like Zn-dependent oxidoreductase